MSQKKVGFIIMLSDKVNYLKGLMDGLGIDGSTKEGKILKLMAEILDEMAVTVEDISDEVDSVVDLIDMIDEDLCDVEDDLYELEEDDADLDEEYILDGEEEDGSFADRIAESELFDDDSFDDEPMYECCCPTCGDSITISESIVEKGSMKCPNCNTHIEFNYEEDEEEN